MPDTDPRGELSLHPGVLRVRRALGALGTTAEVVVLDSHVRTAAQAAAALGVDVGQIASSLIFAVDDAADPERVRPVLVLTSGAHRVDTDQVAGVLGVERLARAEPEFVRRRTGFAIGGVPPVGHTEPVQTLVDVALAAYAEVWAAGGHPRTVFATRYEELLRITAGQPVEVD